jgi:hypothetical protein
MLAIIFVLALEQQTPTSSDAPAPRGYVQGSMLVTIQPEGTTPEGVAPPFSGRTVAVGAQAGRFFTPHLAVEGEFVFGRSIAVSQTLTFYTSSEAYRADSRDLLFNANLRWTPGGGGRVELVGGGGLAISRIGKLNGVLTVTYPSRSQYPLEDARETDHVLNLGGGLDFPIRTNAAVAIVPGFRIRWVHRMDPALASQIGVGAWALHAGAGVRWSFDRRPSAAPPARGPAYMQGAFFISSHPEGTANHRVSPPLGGETFGVSASGGAFVTPAVAIEGEVVVGRTLSAPQRFSYFWREDYTAGVRDLLFSGNVRFRGAGTGPLEVVLGGGLVYTRLSKVNQVRTDGSGPIQRTERYPDYFSSELTPHVGGGIDVPIALGPRVAIGPTFRFRWMFQEREGQGAYMGVGRQLFQAGVSGRVRL